MLFDFILKMTDLGSGLLSGCILSWNCYMHHTLQFEKRNLVDTRADTQILQNGYSFIFNEIIIIRQKQSLCNSN